MSETLTIPPPEEQLGQVAADAQDLPFDGRAPIYPIAEAIDNDVGYIPRATKGLDLSVKDYYLKDAEGRTHVAVNDTAISQERILATREDENWAQETYKNIITVAQMNAEGKDTGVSEARIGLALSAASRVYRLQHTTGLYTSYAVGNHLEKNARQTQAGNDMHPEVLHLKTAQREPVAVTGADVQRLMAEGSRQEKIDAVAEMLDPYRFRTDPDAPKEHAEQKKVEEDLAFDLLSSLEPSPERDMLAVEAIKLYMHRHSERADLLEQSLDLITAPELRSAIVKSLELAADNEPSDILARTRLVSKDALSAVQKNLSEHEKRRQQEVAERLRDKARITINVGAETLASTLFDTHHLMTSYETRGSGGNPSEDGELARRSGEDELGLHDHNEALLERPVYGALALSDEEKLLGAHDAQSYGNIVIGLRSQVAEERTTFTFGDSMNLRSIDVDATPEEQSAKKMVAEDAVVAKVAFDENPPEPGGPFRTEYRYVEAQILGGVGPEDIESITLPMKTVVETPGILRKITDEYPAIEVALLVSAAEAQGLDEGTKQKLAGSNVKIVTMSSRVEQQNPNLNERRPLKHNEEEL